MSSIGRHQQVHVFELSDCSQQSDSLFTLQFCQNAPPQKIPEKVSFPGILEFGI